MHTCMELQSSIAKGHARSQSIYRSQQQAFKNFLTELCQLLILFKYNSIYLECPEGLCLW